MSANDAKELLDGIVKQFDEMSTEDGSGTELNSMVVTIYRYANTHRDDNVVNLEDLRAMLKNVKFHEMQSLASDIKPHGEVK
jgi:hypothetical protein